MGPILENGSNVGKWGQYWRMGPKRILKEVLRVQTPPNECFNRDLLLKKPRYLGNTANCTPPRSKPHIVFFCVHDGSYSIHMCRKSAAVIVADKEDLVNDN